MIFIPAVTLWLCLSMLVLFILCVFCSLGLDQFCRFDQPYPNKQCYAALGHKLILQMDLNPPYDELHLYKMLNDGSTLKVFSINKNKEHKHESIRDRSEFFFDNMTLTINNVVKADSGTYTSYVIEMDMVMTSDLYVNVAGKQSLSSDSFCLDIDSGYALTVMCPSLQLLLAQWKCQSSAPPVG